MRRIAIDVLAAVCLSATASSFLIPAASAGKTGGGQGNPTPGASTAGGLPQVAVSYGATGNVVAQRSFGSGGGSGGGSGSTWLCYYYGFKGVEGSVFNVEIDVASGPVTPEPANLVDLQCRDKGVLVYEEAFTFNPAAPFGAIAAGFDAAALARNTLPLPDPKLYTSPPSDKAQLVGVATWLWVDDPWVTLEASATLGGVTATVRATPSMIEWDPGDGTGVFACDGPGAVWDNDHPSRTSHCTHTYLNRSTVAGPTATFALTATVTYTIVWTATNGQNGTLDALTRSAAIPLLVHEAQALIR